MALLPRQPRFSGAFASRAILTQRTPLGAGAISLICLASMGSRVGWPESPAWLMAQGRTEDVMAVLQQIGKMNGTSLPPDFILISSTAAPEPSNSPASPPLTPVSKRATRVGPTSTAWDYDAVAPPADRWAFLQLPWMKTTAVLLAFLWFLSNFGYGVAALRIDLAPPPLTVPIPPPGIFNSMNLELVAAKLGGVPTSDNTYLQAIYMSAAAPVGALAGAFIVDSPLGRKWTLVVGILTMAASMIGFLRTSTENGVVMTGALTQATSQIMYAALYLYTPEVFPTAVRGCAAHRPASGRRELGRRGVTRRGLTSPMCRAAPASRRCRSSRASPASSRQSSGTPSSAAGGERAPMAVDEC